MDFSSSRRIVQLVDARDPDRKLVPAEVYRDFPSAGLDDLESSWSIARDEAARQRQTVGLASVEHSDWDWRSKIGSVEAGVHKLVAVAREAEVQGIMAVLQRPRRSRLSGDPILYVDYLESAPWNLRLPSVEPRYAGIGTVLIAEAVQLSLDSGLEGRVGLHSLPQAERFYRSRCGMTDLGRDRDYFDLTYFEFTGQRSTEWLAAMGDP